MLFRIFYRILLKSLCLCLGLIMLAGCQWLKQPSSGESLIELNQDWYFFRSTDEVAFSDAQEHSDWELVRLPHTPKIEPYIVNDQFQGDAWYRKTFVADSGWRNKRIWLRFEAAMNHAEVWLNGEKIGEHLGGYLPFTFDITDKIRPGKNHEVWVKLDNRDNPISGPKPLKSLDFNTYGGLYRGVSLIVKHNLHITDSLLEAIPAGGGIFVTYPLVSEEVAVVKVKTHVRNRDNKQHIVRVEHKLFWDDELVVEVITPAMPLSALDHHSIEGHLTVEMPHLWSPQFPNLYRLETRLISGETTIEKTETPIGIREFSFVDNQLLINGKPQFLRGVNRHQEYPYIGYATSAAADFRDALRIKAAGFDIVRLSHYPQSPAFMRAADKIGLVVINSILGWQYFSEDPAFQRQVQQTCRDLIRRDRNHPSVLAWECSLNESTMSEAFMDSMARIVKQEFPGALSAGWQDHAYDIYLQARQHRLKHYETPTKPYFVSEYGDWEYYAGNGGFNQDQWQNLKPAERSSRQLLSAGEARLQQQAKNQQEAHNDNLKTPAFGDAYWVMFDYNRGYAPDLEASGVMSIERLPKFGYYFFQSQRSPNEVSIHYDSGPMVFIASFWQENSSLTFPVFTNTEEVALYLNGELIEKRKPDQNQLSDSLKHPPVTFKLKKFIPGELKAVGFIDGRPVTEHSIKTPGEPVRLSFFTDASGVPPQEGKKDVVFFHVRLLDENGTRVPESNRKVRFSIRGDARLISPVEVETQAGFATALVEIGDTLSDVRITARSDGLKGVTLNVANHKLW